MVDVAELPSDPIRGWQRLHHPKDSGQVGSELRADAWGREGFEVSGRDLADAPPRQMSSESLPGGADRYRRDPRLGALVVPQVMQIVMDRQEHILDDVIHLVASPQHRSADLGHVAYVLTKQRSGVAGGETRPLSGRRRSMARACQPLVLRRNVCRVVMLHVHSWSETATVRAGSDRARSATTAAARDMSLLVRAVVFAPFDSCSRRSRPRTTSMRALV